jgi:hypothetical protein
MGGASDYLPQEGKTARIEMADLRNLSEDEVALIVAMQGGFEPRAEVPLVKALEARGIARGVADCGDAWSLTELGVAYRPDGAT